MKNPCFHRRPNTGAFTLVEMLVVIAIIGILAGILLPALIGVKKRAKIAVAKTEMSGLATAIQQYETEYTRPPLSKEAYESLTTESPDFTCGTVLPDGKALAQPQVVSTGNSGYNNCNSEIVAILMDLDKFPNTAHARNPRNLVLLHGKPAQGPDAPGIDENGVFRDPWGKPYIITVDVNDDNQCQDGFYYPLTKGAKPLLVRGPVMVWSFGPDGTAVLDRKVGAKGGGNKDNVLSWE